MFAFALLDREQRELVLVRDRFGIKPLYYSDAPFAFASELRTLLHVPGVERELDRESLFHYLSLRFVPGERSISRGREAASARAPAPLRPRQPAADRPALVEARVRSAAPSRAELRERLRDAVVRWTLADVPVAVSLSGGLDSSAVTALLAESGARVRTYSLGFAGEDDELPLARALAERWGTDHHEAVVDADELLDDLLQMVWSLDEPYGGGLPSWYVYRFMAEDVKVGLTGTGGDELFGNYRRFVPFERARLRAPPPRRRAPLPLRAVVLLHRRGEARARCRRARTRRRCCSASTTRAAARTRATRCSYLDVATQLPDEFLHVTDRFSMAWSLEARTPFLDHELVEYVASLPPELRTDADDPKRLLREAVADLLTPAHLEAPKQGFVFPLERWLRGELRPLAERLVSPEHLRAQGIFREDANFLSLDAERLWPVLMFQLWHLLYVEEALTEAPTFSWRDLAVPA